MACWLFIALAKFGYHNVNLWVHMGIRDVAPWNSIILGYLHWEYIGERGKKQHWKEKKEKKGVGIVLVKRRRKRRKISGKNQRIQNQRRFSCRKAVFPGLIQIAKSVHYSFGLRVVLKVMCLWRRLWLTCTQNLDVWVLRGNCLRVCQKETLFHRMRSLM